MWNKFWKIINSPLSVIGSLAGIASIVVLFFKEKGMAIVALCLFAVALLLFLVKIFRVLNRFLEKSPSKYNCISTFIQYTCDDGDHVVIDSYKLIQVKCSMMQEIDSGFKWSGSKIPDISSDLQNFNVINVAKNGYEYDQAVLEFKRPVLYNETTLVHFRSRANDTDHQSSTYVELPVLYPIEYIQLCISLGYKDETFNQNATISKQKITNSEQIQQHPEIYDSILFDPKHKQYVYRLINPEIGYRYRIEWER